MGELRYEWRCEKPNLPVFIASSHFWTMSIVDKSFLSEGGEREGEWETRGYQRRKNSSTLASESTLTEINLPDFAKTYLLWLNLWRVPASLELFGSEMNGEHSGQLLPTEALFFGILIRKSSVKKYLGQTREKGCDENFGSNVLCLYFVRGGQKGWNF